MQRRRLDTRYVIKNQHKCEKLKRGEPPNEKSFRKDENYNSRNKLLKVKRFLFSLDISDENLCSEKLD